MDWAQDTPDWKDSGKPIELMAADGSVVTGKLCYDDFFWTGEEEVPLWLVALPSGDRPSIQDFDRWRLP